jgi:ribonucleoside-diphosphate reductase alpha chain
VSYYEPQGLALDIFLKRYAIHPHETFGEACDRVAYHIAQAEQGDKISFWRHEFAEVLKQNLFFPGGRIMFGSGRPKGQLLNCFVVPTNDSREGWGKTVSDMIVIAGTGGGLGTNGSPVRPRDSIINGSGGKATGAVSLFNIMNAAGEVIKGGGGRRVALMLALEHDHGDILEFLDEKLDLNKLNNANVSVIFKKNPEIFFEKVRKDEDYELQHNGKSIGKMSAKKIWHKIISNALKNGEPGILNSHLANKMSNIGYYTPLICTNPCGEIWLAAYDCCDLGSIVLPRFVKEDEKDIDWDLLKKVVTTGVRFLDNVLTVNNYPLPEIKEQCSNIRRVGLGITGLHDMLLKMGLKYNSANGLEFVDKVMDKIKNWAFEASSDIAAEKGAFPKFDPENYLKGGFAKTLKPSIREKIREQGMRNCAVLTVAPVGTGSMVCDSSSGIEPMFAPAYKRKYRDGDKLKEEIVVHPLFKRFMDEGRSVKHFQGAHDLKLKDHFEMQRVVQRHIDNAVSKTINVPHGVKEAELSELYMEYFPDLKGVTVYPEGSREDQPLTPMDIDEAIKAYKNHAESAAAVEDKCKSGVCEL